LAVVAIIVNVVAHGDDAGGGLVKSVELKEEVLENVDIQDPKDKGTEDEQGTDEGWTIVQRKKKNLVNGKKQRKVPNRTGSL
jgi:hypothetical protein